MTDSHWSAGDTITQTGLGGRVFVYRLLGIEPYVRRNGAETILLSWEGRCTICGDAFIAKSGRKPRYLVRTCLADRGTPRDLWPAARDG